GAAARDVDQEVEEGGYLGVLLGRRARGEQALEALDAAQREMRRCVLDGARDTDGGVHRAAAGAAAREAARKEDLQRPADRLGARGLAQALDTLDGIDEAVEVEFWIGAQRVEDGGDLLAADELVGEHHAVDAEGAADLHLVDAGDGDAPGA